jgi:hypothetical protein
VIAQAGSSPDGRELAARTAELIFTAAQTLDEAQAFGADIAGRLARHGRRRDDVRILPGVAVYVGRDADDARAQYEALQDLLDPESALRSLSRFVNIGVDLWTLPLDEPVRLPDVIPETNTHKSRQQLVVDLVRRERPTVRQLLRKLTAGGTASCSAMPATSPTTSSAGKTQAPPTASTSCSRPCPPRSTALSRMSCPNCSAATLLRRDYEGKTLRENLGLPRPPDRSTTGYKQSIRADAQAHV